MHVWYVSENEDSVFCRLQVHKLQRAARISPVGEKARARGVSCSAHARCKSSSGDVEAPAPRLKKRPLLVASEPPQHRTVLRIVEHNLVWGCSPHQSPANKSSCCRFRSHGRRMLRQLEPPWLRRRALEPELEVTSLQQSGCWRLSHCAMAGSNQATPCMVSSMRHNDRTLLHTTAHRT